MRCFDFIFSFYRIHLNLNLNLIFLQEMKIVIRTRKVIVLYIAILRLCCIRMKLQNYEKIVNSPCSLAKVVRVV
jgi:hypothetical protein